MSRLGMKRLGCLAILSLLPITLVFAQRPGRGRGGARPAGVGNRPAEVMPGAMNRSNVAMANQRPMQQANAAGQNMNAQNMAAGGCDVGAMAQMMMANYDADGSGALNQMELAAALQGLQQMMMQGGGGNANGQVQNQQFQNPQVQDQQAGVRQAGFGDARRRQFGQRGR